MNILKIFNTGTNLIKAIALLVIVGVLILALAKFQSCGDGDVVVTENHVPADTNFAPTIEQEYTAPSLPFQKKKFPVELPKGIKEKDIAEITTIKQKSEDGKPAKQIDIIKTKDGETFIKKDSSIESITVTHFNPPTMNINFRFGVGFTASYIDKKLKPLPAAFIAPVEWFGWLQLPTLGADLDGVGPGLGIKLYHDIYIGANHLWQFEEGNKEKLSIAYYF